MDEGLLNDLLECSVCLERLDTSSRVLPCQHTFCLKCLKVIVESHRELRCPECRILVETKLEDLPPNVLLMRILEGMRNCGPKKVGGSQRAARSGQGLSPSIQAGAREGKSIPAHARALYDYISKEQGDLSFKRGETILLQKKLDPFWYQGECDGRSGMFPITYVQVLVPLAFPTALCKALYDFRMSAPDEEGCLAFDKGAIITVVRRVDENWAEGRLESRLGIFPIAFVELNHAAKQLMNTPPLNRPVPPLPELSRPSHSEHRHHTQHSQRYQQMSISTPAAGQANYQNIANMSQSQPNYHAAQPVLAPTSQILVQPINHAITSISHGLLSTTALPRNILEPKSNFDFINFTNMHNKGSQQTMGIQSVSRIGENYDRLRSAKYENYSTPVHKETTYQNVRSEHFPVTVASFNANVSSDSSSSVNTPSVGVSSTTTPNSSSNTSSCESAEPSLPSSPDNNATNEPAAPPANPIQPTQETEENASLDTSMGVLSLNESSTATNTSLNVSLPPAESPPKLTAGTSGQNQDETEENTSNNEPCRVEPSTSKNLRSSGPDSLMNFGLGLQAALSPSHGKDGSYMASRAHREREHHRERDKRHSLTPSSHLQGNHSNQNRHSTEIATSLLDQALSASAGAGRERRRRRSAERALPASYVALYPYRPMKPDELELCKGGVYVVTERCRDGWYKGWSERGARAGVFPGNYLAPIHHHHDKSATQAVVVVPVAKPVVATPTVLPPDAPPRENSPHNNTGQQSGYAWSSQQSTPKTERPKDKSKQDKCSISSGVSLMKRLAAMKKCKSPPCAGYSIDNPVFEDCAGSSALATHQPVHVRSGSCPSQLLLTLPGSERIRHKERPTILHHQFHRPTADGTWQGQHRKSQSLDVTATRRDKHHAPPLNERFRCIVPYPPNSDYELELKVDDIVIVSRKRGDGWYKGTLQRTGRTGLFPASFVQSCPESE